jgi:shikimate kinase
MNITITGPRSVGKSTISKLVAKKLKRKYISSDEIGNKATKSIGGLDKAIKSGEIRKIIKNKGYTLITNVYKKQKNFVFDLSGGSFTYKKVPKASLEVRKSAKKNSVIIGLLPSKNIISSAIFLYKREIKKEHFKDSNKVYRFWKTLKNLSRFPRIFNEWADLIIYTKNKSPEEIAEEIIGRIEHI